MIAPDSFPESYARELAEIAARERGFRPALLHRAADALEQGRRWCRRALAEHHLVTVASYLTQRLGVDPDGLDLLGVPIDILHDFPDWRRGVRDRFRPQPSGLTPVPAGAGNRLRAEYDAFARQRHPQLLAYAKALDRLGYRVCGMPDLRIDPHENVFASTNLDFSYCNVLPGLRRGRPAVFHFTWGIPALDGAATAGFRRAGLDPIPIATAGVANALMRLQGLHCFCGALI